jgi:hypothetical protein
MAEQQDEKMAGSTGNNDNAKTGNSNTTPPVGTGTSTSTGTGKGSNASNAASPALSISIPPVNPGSKTPKRLSASAAPVEPTEKIVTDPDNMYVFIGGEAQVGTTRLSGYGTVIKIAEMQTLEDVVCGGVGIVPKSVWDKAKFTDEELEKHDNIVTHNPDDADISFLRKVVTMRVAYNRFAQPIIQAVKWRTHQDAIKRSEEAGIAARERQAAMYRLLQEFNPDHPPLAIHPSEMLVRQAQEQSNNGEITGFEPMGTVIEIVKSDSGDDDDSKPSKFNKSKE